MKTVAAWASGSAIAGFAFFFVALSVLLRDDAPPSQMVRIVAIFSIMGSIASAALGAIVATAKVLFEELRETRRELKHWISLQHLDIELDKPSTHIKLAPPSGRG